jgi:hypothetical protein
MGINKTYNNQINRTGNTSALNLRTKAKVAVVFERFVAAAYLKPLEA